MIAPTAVNTAPAMPKRNAAGIHTKPFGGFRFALLEVKRETAKRNKVPASTNQKICETAQASNHAAIVVPIGAPMPIAISVHDGAAVPVRRGIMVNKKPIAKLIKK